MTPDIVEIFANNLRAFRRGRGLTQSDLAQLAGLSLNYIGILERGEKAPTIVTLAALAAAMDLKPTQLIAPGMPKREG